MLFAGSLLNKMILLLFIIGLIVGSFLNVVICRLKTQESIITKRSYCPYCKKKLAWHELIPLMSFVLQKGKCRKCKKKISWQYPLVELATGILFASVFKFVTSQEAIIDRGSIISLLFWLFVISCLIIIFVYDLKHYIIPDKIIYPAIIIAFIYQLQYSFFNFKFSIDVQFPIFNYLLAGLIAGLFFLIIILASKGKWMGVGDLKLAVFMGLVLGWPDIFAALFLSFLTGALVSLILIILNKKKLKSEIPFAPFLTAATLITIFWGDILITWYFNLLL